MADIARKADAHWTGDLMKGQGTISTESGTLKDAQYSFKTRFENGVGTNPEELLGRCPRWLFHHAAFRDPGRARA